MILLKKILGFMILFTLLAALPVVFNGIKGLVVTVVVGGMIIFIALLVVLAICLITCDEGKEKCRRK